MKNRILGVFFLFFTTAFAQITFDADFESGNLKSVSAVDSSTFNVETNEDIQGRWFYFRISGVKDKFITVNVTTVPHDFTQAMYSYDNEEYFRFSVEESPQSGTFQKLFEEDTVYVSYYTPYTFNYLQNRINEWNLSSYVTVDTIGLTNHFLPIQEIIVTNPNIPASEKKSVWIHARTHPSETPSSWHFDGIMQELLSNDDVINYYLDNIEFHLIPFTNPDGVFYGRSRTNYDGIDVESNWDNDEISTTREVELLKARMKELNDEKPFSVFLNLHSQASSYCTFWIHKANSTSNYFYRREYQFANLNISDNPYFNYEDYSESNLRAVFPEGWLWNNYGDQVMALTYETPYNNYHYDSSNVIVTNDNLFQIGKRTVYAIAEYLEISHPKHYIVDNSIAEFEGMYSIYDVENQFFGDDFAAIEANDNYYAVYTAENLPSGNYSVSAWWATGGGNSYDTKFEISDGSNFAEISKTQKINGGQWNHLMSFEHTSNNPIEIKVLGNTTGLVIADAFRLVYTSPITSIDKESVPKDFQLYQNYPNPFNPSTTIQYSVPSIGSAFNDGNKVTLKVYDILGRLVTTLVDEYQSTGEYKVIFDASSTGNKLASGTYFYRLQIGDRLETRKMILLK